MARDGWGARCDKYQFATSCAAAIASRTAMAAIATRATSRTAMAALRGPATHCAAAPLCSTIAALPRSARPGAAGGPRYTPLAVATAAITAVTRSAAPHQGQR